MPGGAEAGDHFGNHLATVDYNEDGYTDLVVSASEENVGSAVDAGFVDILFGGENGLGSGPAARHFEQGAGNGSIAASTPETGDRMGASLAAGTTAEGRPWVLIGTPGEALGSLAKAGGAFYVHGDTNVSVNQDTGAVPGAARPTTPSARPSRVTPTSSPSAPPVTPSAATRTPATWPCSATSWRRRTAHRRRRHGPGQREDQRRRRGR